MLKMKFLNTVASTQWKGWPEHLHVKNEVCNESQHLILLLFLARNMDNGKTKILARLRCKEVRKIPETSEGRKQRRKRKRRNRHVVSPVLDTGLFSTDVFNHVAAFAMKSQRAKGDFASITSHSFDLLRPDGDGLCSLR